MVGISGQTAGGSASVQLLPGGWREEDIHEGEGIVKDNGVLTKFTKQPSDGVIAHVANKVGIIFLTSLAAFKGVFGDVDATSDLLGLFVDVTKLTENAFPSHLLQLLAKAFKSVKEFFSARSGFSRAHSFLSGEAATAEKICGGRDYLRVLNKGVFFIVDGCSMLKWLSSIGVIGTWLVTSKVSKTILGRVVVISMDSIATAGIIAATVPNLLDNIRLMVKYRKERSDTLMEARKIKLVTFSFGSVADICRIASVILFVSATPWVTGLSIGFHALGIAAALIRFYYVAHTKEAKEKENNKYLAKKEVIVQMAERYVQLAALEMNVGIDRDVVEGIYRKLNQKTPLAIQRGTTDQLVRELLEVSDGIGNEHSRNLLVRAGEKSALRLPALPPINLGNRRQTWVVSA